MDQVQERAKQVHINRLEAYPYLWRFKFASGATRVIGSENDRPPMGIASRVGNQSGYGVVVSSSKLPKEAKEAHIREMREDLERIKKEEKLEKLKDLWTPEVQHAPNGYSIEYSKLPEYYTPSKEEPENEPLRIDPEISKNDIPVEDLVKSSEEEADEELVGHIIALQTALKSALEKVPRTIKGSEILFTLASDADDDSDYAEFLALYVRRLQIRFVEVVNDVDHAFECIIENLEGA